MNFDPNTGNPINNNQGNGYPQPPYQPGMPNSGKGFAIASMVLGIVACVFCWFGWFSIAALIISVVGLVLAVKARNEMPVGAQGRGMATAGLVLSIIGIVLSGIAVVCWICVAGIALAA